MTATTRTPSRGCCRSTASDSGAAPAPLATLLADHGLTDDPLFAQAKLRGIRALAGHAETTDVTNDVNGGPSGIGIGSSAGKAAFWDFVGAPSSLKVMALEGEFAMTAGHAQELKTQAVAQQVGKRLRILLSYNNAGIDDRLQGGVVPDGMDGYDIAEQWASYGWNVRVAGQRQLLRRNPRRDALHGAVGCRRPAPDDRGRPHHQGLVAGRHQWRHPGVRRATGRLPQPSLRDEDERAVLRRTGRNLRTALRGDVLGHPRRRGR